MPRSPERQPQPESGSSLSTQASQIEAQILTLKNMYAGSREKPEDYLQDVFLGDDFRALSPEEQAALRSRHGIEAAPAAEPAVTPEAPPVQEQPEKTETRGGKPKTWLFDNYALRQDPETGAFFIFENKSKYHENKGRYVRNRDPRRTAISLPEELAVRLQQEPELKRQVIEFCEQVRRQLDEPGDKGGLALLFDPPRREGDERYLPKWKFTLDSEPKPGGRRAKPREETVGVGQEDWDADAKEVTEVDQLPADVYAVAQRYWLKREQGEVAQSERYWNKPLWRAWYGKAIQRKRENIITAELARRHFETAAATVPPPMPERPRVETPERPPAEQPAAQPISPEPTGPAAWFETPTTPERPIPLPESAPNAPTTPAERPVQPKPETAPEKRDTGHRDQELLEAGQPVYAKLLPVIAELYQGREKEDKLAIIKQATKSTLEVLKERYGRTKDAEVLDRILRIGFVEKLSGAIFREFTRQESAKKFFEKHAFFDENSVEVADDNRVTILLDKLGRADEANILEKAARQLVFDALYGEEALERGDDLAGDETRLVALVAETLRRLRNQKADIVEYDERSGRVAITDLAALRQVIRSKVRPPKR